MTQMPDQLSQRVMRQGPRMEIALRQLSLPELQAVIQEPVSFAWPGTVYPGSLPPPFVLQRALAMVLRGESADWWIPYLVVEQSGQAIVGGSAFKGAPKSGRVEVLYGISKEFRGNGLASAAVTKLVAIAFERGADEVLAEIEPSNAGSIGVVKRCGFTRLGERTAEDGVVVEQWILVRKDPGSH